MTYISPPSNFRRDDQNANYWRSPNRSIVVARVKFDEFVYVFTDWTGWELYDVDEYNRMKVVLECL